MRACPVLGPTPLTSPTANAFYILSSVFADLLFVYFLYSLWVQRSFRAWAYFLLYCGVQCLSLILKEIIRSPRPFGSCNHGYGMPSNHVSSVASVLSFWAVESLWINSQPINPKQLNMWKPLVAFLYLTLLMVSRVQLKYHTASQVSAGAILGGVIGVVYPYATRLIRLESWLGWLNLIPKYA
jgi:membrane-associated phospholipid phosphatase